MNKVGHKCYGAFTTYTPSQSPKENYYARRRAVRRVLKMLNNTLIDLWMSDSVLLELKTYSNKDPIYGATEGWKFYHE
jgi:hypothetical protein